MLLNATLPKIFQRKVLRWLPTELGQYLLEAGKGFAFAGEIALVCARLSELQGLGHSPVPLVQGPWYRILCGMNWLL